MSQPSNHESGSVERGTPTASAAGPEHRALEVLIGRWINEGETVATDETPAAPIVTSDVYEWGPGGFFVVHLAYGRIGDLGVGGVEIIRYDADTRAYQCYFFDSEGGTSRQELVLGDGAVTWEGGGTRCDATFEDGGRVLVAHHKMMGEHGTGIGGMALSRWLAPLEAFRELEGEQGGEVNASTAVVESRTENIGATVMGRNTFGGEMQGGTTFRFPSSSGAGSGCSTIWAPPCRRRSRSKR
jgi:hypothetical protein